MAVIFFLDKENWKLLKSYRIYVAAVIFGAVISPHIIWLAGHDFICLFHVQKRLQNEFNWYTPLTTAGTALYPFMSGALVLFLASLPDFRTRVRKNTERKTLRDALLMSLIPAGMLVLISLCGRGVIMMWFCTMAAFTGIALTAAFPLEIDLVFFRRVVLLLMLYCFIIFTATSCDLLFSSRPRIHSEPASYVQIVEKFWKKHSPDPIPVVGGNQFAASLLENYMPGRPPAFATGDPVFLEHYRKLIDEKGALLIGSPREIEFFFEDSGRTPVRIHEFKYKYAALAGRVRENSIFLAYMPPLEKRKEK